MCEKSFMDGRRGYSLWQNGLIVLVLLIMASFTVNPIHSLSAHLRQTFSARFPPTHLKAAHQQCQFSRAPAGPPPHFSKRTQNDRFALGTRATVIRNATVFDGHNMFVGKDVFVDQGLIVSLESTMAQIAAPSDAVEVEAWGRWLTPGIIDMHTHLGVQGMPDLPTHSDTNSNLSPVRPMVRSVDGLNEHDISLRTTLAGGVTSALVLPGSLNNIGGHAYPIKLGDLHGRPPSSRLIDPPRALTILGEADHGRDGLYSAASGMRRPDGSTSFRQIKMACGENALQYGLVRPDEAWNFRSTFERAAKLREKQDDFCQRLDDGLLNNAPPEESHFPNDLELDILVDVLRGRTKVHTHCYTMNDLDALVRHANEFAFSIAAFHHAHETYLVPSTLHAAPGSPPAAAIFSTNAYYKYESYFGTPFLAELLQSHNITPIFKSDHPVTDSRRLVNQAAQAHHFGLDELEALKSVTSHPARVLGLDHRIGRVARGYDADLVLWDRHPLQLGATPVAVYVDGVSQLGKAYASGGEALKTGDAPPSADYSHEFQRVRNESDAIASGRARAFPEPIFEASAVVLRNVSRVFQRANDSIHALNLVSDGTLVYANGRVTCVDAYHVCHDQVPPHALSVHLHGGTVLPGLTSYGSTLGLSDVPSESSASNGQDPSLLTRHLYLDTKRLVPRAEDGLIFGGHALRRAHASGVTTAVNVPATIGMFGGVSTHFDTGARTVLDAHSVRTSEVALHVRLAYPIDDHEPSLATQLALLRSLLRNPPPGSVEWHRVSRGEWPLVVKTNAQDTVAKLILLKRAFPQVHLIIDSAGALHEVAKDLAEAHIPVIVPAKVWEYGWEQRGRKEGPPLTADTELGVLLRHGVEVGVRVQEAWEAANLLWETVWAAQEAHVSDATTILALVTTNLERMLHLHVPSDVANFVAFDRDPFTYGAKVVAIGTPRSCELLSAS